MRLFLTLCFALLTFCNQCIAYADAAFVQRPDVQNFINFMVKNHGFNKQYITQVMNDVQIQPQIIESMEKPYEKKPWDIYKQLFITQQRIDGGIAFWKANHQALLQAEKQYKVPASVIVAIIGVETFYGKHQGNYRVLDALSTLAFNYPKRSAFFTKELTEYLLLCREHQVAPTQYLGSYAGAMGKPQFMPSSYRYYAADFLGRPKKDLMNDDSAVIASVANYFHKHGWSLNQSVAQPARVTGNQVKRINTNFKNATYAPKQLIAAGIRPLLDTQKQPNKVGLIALETAKGSEYWLTYPNFYVITRYNNSPQYALAVYLLAQELQHQWAALTIKKSAYV
ncbi:membrane bound lytic murein transglycosylase [Legionella beliardensis]|uniref:Membrane bound lytic murein transglycosylase n=1 Tax=Legionella beliardensis TaxID=91822 RepID=A0A378I3L8_9GAMM|nr:lytic murein transglycosylase B [Legionella beliardensis]STX29360.1 membrane bound lytic murein transglycosylase [Legionella beliardensis]